MGSPNEVEVKLYRRNEQLEDMSLNSAMKNKLDFGSNNYTLYNSSTLRKDDNWKIFLRMAQKNHGLQMGDVISIENNNKTHAYYVADTNCNLCEISNAFLKDRPANEQSVELER